MKPSLAITAIWAAIASLLFYTPIPWFPAVVVTNGAAGLLLPVGLLFCGVISAAWVIVLRCSVWKSPQKKVAVK